MTWNIVSQVLHGCRQLVWWHVGLISRTSETHPLCIYSQGTASDRLEAGMDDVKSSWPLWTGLHTCYNGVHNKLLWWKSAPTSNVHPSSDWCLQLDIIKMESLVIVDQHATVNTYLSLVLPARHTPGVPCSGSICTLCYDMCCPLQTHGIGLYRSQTTWHN